MKIVFYNITNSFIIIIIISFVYYFNIKYKNIYYYKCKVNEKYYTNKYYIPLCSYDNNYKTINYYGYIYYKEKKKYTYEIIKNPYSINNRILYNTSANISIHKVEVKKKYLSLCLVSIFKNLNIMNIIRTCLLYKLLGVEHITIYVSYYDFQYKKCYRWLMKQNWIDIIHFSLPRVDIFYYGQDAKLDHCINHYRYISTYVIITDVDETIVPVENKYIIDIINKYGKNNYAFSFKSVIFLVNSTQSNIFLANRKGCIIHKWYKKLIIRPEKIISVGAHFPRKWQEKGKIISININDAYVRHARTKNYRYKNCSFIYQSNYLFNFINIIERKIENLS